AVDIISSRTILFTQLVCAQRLSLRRDQSFGPIRGVLSVLPSPNLIYRSASILWQGWSVNIFSSRSDSFLYYRWWLLVFWPYFGGLFFFAFLDRLLFI